MARHYKNSPLTISVMTGKLSGIDALNTNPLTNDFCKKMSENKNSICHYCYSRRMLKTFRCMCTEAFQRNSRILSEQILTETQLFRPFTQYFRINAHGELINHNHIENCMNLIKYNPAVFFGLWTKRVNLVRGYTGKLKNVNFVYSTPKLNVLKPKLPAGFNKVFSVYTKDFAVKNSVKVNCHGNCNACKICYTRNRVKYVNEIIKSEQ